jgi:hypothetical protein
MTRGTLQSKVLNALWPHAQDLTFGEIRQAVDVAVRAAEDKILQIRKANFIKAGKNKGTK